MKRLLNEKTFERFDQLRTDHYIRRVCRHNILEIDLGGSEGTCALSFLSICGHYGRPD